MRVLPTWLVAMVLSAGVLPPSPARTGEPQRVSTFTQLEAAVRAANDGARDPTILLADGTYDVTSPSGLFLTRSGITIRSASGNRDAVILQGNGMLGGRVSHIFQIVADDITIRDVTLRNVANHAVQIHGETPYDADRPVIGNLVIRDTGEQMIKVSYRDGESTGSEGGRIEDSLFEYTAGAGPQSYIGGIDAHRASQYVVRHNTFRNIRSPGPSLAEHAIHFWSQSADTLVERNLIVDCDRGIGFGLGTSRGHVNGIIRNNMVFHADRGTDFGDVGIELESAPGARVLHNTVYLLHPGAPGGIAVRFASSTGVEIQGNLVRVAGGAPGIWLRDGATAHQVANVLDAQAAWFVDAPSGNLHLAGSNIQGVTDAASPSNSVEDDFDGDPRPAGPAPDVGADEVAN